MVDDKGRWLVKGKVKALKEPSQEYTDKKNLEIEKESLNKQKQDILRELKELDKEIPRILEDIIEHTNFTPHKNKSDIIDRKKQLREQLKNLGG